MLTCSELEQATSTTVPGSTGNAVVVVIVLVHSVFSPVHFPEGAGLVKDMYIIPVSF